MEVNAKERMSVTHEERRADWKSINFTSTGASPLALSSLDSFPGYLNRMFDHQRSPWQITPNWKNKTLMDIKNSVYIRLILWCLLKLFHSISVFVEYFQNQFSISNGFSISPCLHSPPSLTGSNENSWPTLQTTRSYLYTLVLILLAQLMTPSRESWSCGWTRTCPECCEEFMC